MEERSEHSAEMYENHGHGLTKAQHDLVYAYAYQEGHAYGHSEIEGYYQDLSDLAVKLINAGQDR